MRKNKRKQFHIITLFPKSIDGSLGESIIGRAQREGKLKVSYYNPRDFTKDRWRRVDQRPYGGGPGMVLEAASILKAAQRAVGKRGAEVLFLSPSGKQFDSAYAKKLAKSKKDILIISGHYEGVDARVKKILKAKEVSVGPYTLTGGELPAAIIIDATARHIPGVLGKYESLEDERISSPDVYTRPEVLVWKKRVHRVPKVLLSGHHAKIEEWKRTKHRPLKDFSRER